MDLNDIKGTSQSEPNQKNESPKKKIGFFLGTGIFFMPYIFSWFTLRKGHSSLSRGVSFVWMGIICIAAMSGNGHKTSGHRATASSVNQNTSERALTFIDESCSLVSDSFGSSSKMSNIQKKEKWKDLDGKAFKWNLEVSEVSEALLGDGYQVQFKCTQSNSLISDVMIKFPATAKNRVMGLQKGSLYTIEAKLQDYNSLIGLTAEAL